MTMPITRRAFMRTSAVALTGASAPSTLTTALWAEPMVTYPGIQLYTVDKELKADVNATLNTIQHIGYKEVEGAALPGISAKQFRAALDRAGLKCNSTHFFNWGEVDPSAIFEQANTLGVHYVVSSFIGKFGRSRTGGEAGVDEYKAMAEYFNQLGGAAKQAGLQLAFHNHNTEFKKFEQGRVGYDIFIEATDPDLVKLELDCGWMVAAGYNPIDYFKRYPNRYRMVHIKDFMRRSQPSTSLEKADVPQGTVLGTGYIKYKPILAVAKAAGVEHFYIEQEPPFIGMTAIEAATRDYQYLESISQ
ncbi:sugar phosphate isomerase/epimerase [Terriglobus albidus]|uniref:Sugar phosphate isomerase/epimerase n=1 Tax=Terriglobus albidus TaxID=1592106 RepID=A0A5B9EF24_9BACT|nr:sugar phosphate isomerase/epimerase [Terriglobus albidus]QEE28917.1 sugar phosphate isomerase/epimerase [Terriglobus albidus]